MTRNERRKAARIRKAELREAVSDCLRIEAERVERNQRLRDILDTPIATVWSSRGQDASMRQRFGRVATQGGVRKYLSKDAPLPVEPKPRPEGMSFDAALRQGLVGTKRRPMIGKNLKK